jgi:ABC-type multidrug transport system permease subunit
MKVFLSRQLFRFDLADRFLYRYVRTILWFVMIIGVFKLPVYMIFVLSFLFLVTSWILGFIIDKTGFNYFYDDVLLKKGKLKDYFKEKI